jgi:hypothetical protein
MMNPLKKFYVELLTDKRDIVVIVFSILFVAVGIIRLFLLEELNTIPPTIDLVTYMLLFSAAVWIVLTIISHLKN